MKPRRAQGSVRWVVWSAIGVAVAAAVYVGYLALRPTVLVTEAVEGEAVQAFYATGTLQPVREYPLRSATTGTVQKPKAGKTYVDKGRRVTRGQALAVVIDPELAYAADKARAAAEEERLRADEKTSPVLKELDAKIVAGGEVLEIARREHVRVSRLLESGGAGQSDFDRSLDRLKTLGGEVESLKSAKETARLLLRRELEEAESALRTANWNLEQQTLRVPDDLEQAVVLDRPVSLGTRLAVNDPVMTVADVRPDKLVMRASVDEEDVTSVRVGQVVRMVLYAFAAESFDGKVIEIYPKADPDRRTFEVDVALERIDPRFAAGMTGELAFEVQRKPRATVIPSQAVQDGKVYVVRNGRVRGIDAKVGLRGVERTEIVEGVRVGDRVIVSPIGDIGDGRAVGTTYTEPAAAAAQNKPKAREGGKFGF